MSIITIAAVDRKMGIGKDGGIPWKSDLAFFKKMTVGHIVIMGRKTWESLKVQPLPDRINIVISTKLDEGRWKKSKEDQAFFYTVKSIGAALRIAEVFYPDKEVFVIGGEKLYRSAMDAGVVDAVLLTKYACEMNCDTYFPCSTAELEQRFPHWKCVQIDNDGEIPLARFYYSNE